MDLLDKYEIILSRKCLLRSTGIVLADPVINLTYVNTSVLNGHENSLECLMKLSLLDPSTRSFDSVGLQWSLGSQVILLPWIQGPNHGDIIGEGMPYLASFYGETWWVLAQVYAS